MNDQSPKPFTIPLEEIEIHIEETADEYFIARALHRPTMTIKISDWWPEKDKAIAQAVDELQDLLKERLAGLGRR